jgi:hypothetical protein
MVTSSSILNTQSDRNPAPGIARTTSRARRAPAAGSQGDYAWIPGVNGQVRVATYDQENPRTPGGATAGCPGQPAMSLETCTTWKKGTRHTCESFVYCEASTLRPRHQRGTSGGRGATPRAHRGRALGHREGSGGFPVRAARASLPQNATTATRPRAATTTHRAPQPAPARRRGRPRPPGPTSTRSATCPRGSRMTGCGHC